MGSSRRRIFVFGSNTLGVHGAGAAKHARLKHGAVHGVGEGLTGNAYAIPTKAHPYKSRSLDEVAESVAAFVAFAACHPEMDFEVTRIGCGLAGFKEEEIAPLFRNAPPNCELPEGWRKLTRT